MSGANRVKAMVAGGLILAGVLFALLPREWIEERLGVEPDAGSGLLELALAIVPIVVGMLLAATVYLAQRARRARQASAEAVLDS